MFFAFAERRLTFGIDRSPSLSLMRAFNVAVWQQKICFQNLTTTRGTLSLSLSSLPHHRSNDEFMKRVYDRIMLLLLLLLLCR